MYNDKNYQITELQHLPLFQLIIPQFIFRKSNM